MKTLRVTLFGALFLILTACASLGVPAPKTFADKVSYANSTLTAVVNATSTSLEAGQLSVAEAKSVREIATQARALLDSARAASDANVANQNLTLAITVLEQLQTYLNQRSKP